MSVLFISPGGDEAADQAAQWATDARGRMGGVTHGLNGALATPDTIRQAISDPNTVFVAYFGHGEPSSWVTMTGVLLGSGDVGVFSNKAAVAVACYTGQHLGPLAANHGGATIYVGFTTPIAWVPNYDESVAAVGALVCDVVHAVVAATISATPKTQVQAEVKRLISKHISKWERRRWQGDQLADMILRDIALLQTGVVVS